MIRLEILLPTGYKKMSISLELKVYIHLLRIFFPQTFLSFIFLVFCSLYLIIAYALKKSVQAGELDKTSMKYLMI